MNTLKTDSLLVDATDGTIHFERSPTKALA
jgi:hypothetical protein